MMADWEQQGPEYYSKLQREIILDAADMLRPGGKLLIPPVRSVSWKMRERSSIFWNSGRI